MAQIRASNIANNTLEAISFDLPTSNLINISALAFSTANTANNLAQAANTTAAAQLSQIGSSLPLISNIIVTDASFNNVSHTSTAANTTGDFISVRGTGFASGANVIFGSFSNGFITATTTTFVDSQRLNVTIPARAAGLYPVYVVNPTGGTGIRLPGLRVTTFPSWTTGTTLASATTGSAYSNTLVATADSTITYSNTTALPAGLSLAPSTGVISGTPTTAATSTFTVLATDVEGQANARTFSLTVSSVPESLFLWGKNNYGQLGLNNRVNLSSPVQIGGTASDWSITSLSNYANFGVKTTGTLWAFGGRFNNGLAGLNESSTVYRSSPVQVGSSTNWSTNRNRWAHGANFMVTIKTDGTLWGWGYNLYGQLGTNDRVNRSSPVQVGAATNWSSVSTGSSDSAVVALKTDGTLWAMGLNNFGELGQNNTIYRSSPVQITGIQWSAIEKNGQATFALRTNGTLWFWGRNVAGVSGNNTPQNQHFSSPVQIGSNTNWNIITGAGPYKAAVTKTDGTLWAWGSNQAGQLGFNDRVYRSSPVQVGTNTNWSFISSGANSTMAKKTDGTLWTWGGNNNGQLGLGDKFGRSSPVQVGTSTKWANQQPEAEGDLAAARTIPPSNTLFLWGYNDYGALGINQNPSVTRSSPTQVGTDTNWRSIYLGDQHSFGIKTDGTLWGWGRNSSGELGLNDRVYRSSPVQISGTNWSYMAASQSTQMGLAVKTDGTLWSWGRNQNGQLGSNNVTYRSSPVQVGTNTNWNLISVGQYQVLATKTDGTLWTWGQTGCLNVTNATANRSSPTQVGTGTNWRTIRVGSVFARATKTDGTLWTWGSQNIGNGGLGLNTSASTDSRSSPTQVGTDTNWRNADGFILGGVATKTDGTLWTWGRDAGTGALGQNSTIDRSSPTQVGTNTNWNEIDGANQYGIGAIKTDGTLWAWGQGQFAVQNVTFANASSPVQIGTGTNWQSISFGQGQGSGIVSS